MSRPKSPDCNGVFRGGAYNTVTDRCRNSGRRNGSSERFYSASMIGFR